MTERHKMAIEKITINDRIGCTATGKTASKKKWKLSDSLKEKIAEYAKEDAARNVYMGNKFSILRKSEVAKGAPDRAALMGKINQAMASDSMENLQKIKDADERWLCILFGKPYEARIQSEGMGNAIHVYDENGDEILTYTAGVGWHEKESKAETEVHGALKATYYNAYHAKRQEMKNGSPAGFDAVGMAEGMAIQGSFDARA